MNRESLVELFERGTAPEFLLFWGHRQKRDGVVDASCLSQWFPARFEVDGESYATAEHWMMAGKAALFADPAMRERILAADDPKAAKALGREVHGFDQQTWGAARHDLVVQGNAHKFGARPAFRDFLLQTGDRVLVEASPRDRIWGIGLGRNNERAQDPREWRGENLLGFVLMEVRAALADGHQP